MYEPSTFSAVKGVTYRDGNGELKYCVINPNHPLWDTVSNLDA